jgi:2-amino-4-hydroxy-6-hydroxymethyldihydropteridine diphosphokinase
VTQRAYLSLGSNLGDRESNLRAAVSALSDHIRALTLSSLYATEPFGFLDQPPFLNMALAGLTDLQPEDLLSTVKRIERALGRTPTVRWGPRVVDIAIILYGNLVFDSADLVIPHPRMAERAFVLIPLAEIAPEVVHPGLSVRASELLERVPGRESVRLLRPYNPS